MKYQILIVSGLLSLLPAAVSAALLAEFDFAEGSGNTTYSTNGNYQFQFNNSPTWTTNADLDDATGLVFSRVTSSWARLAAVGATPYTNFFDQTLTSRTFTVETVFSLQSVSQTDRQNWSILSATVGTRTLFDLAVTYRNDSGDATFLVTNPFTSDTGSQRLLGNSYDLADYLNVALYVAVSYNGNYGTPTGSQYRFNIVIGVAGTDTILYQTQNISVTAAWSDIMNFSTATWNVGGNTVTGTYSDVTIGSLKFYDEALSLDAMKANMAAVTVVPEPVTFAVLAGALVALVALLRRRQ